MDGMAKQPWPVVAALVLSGAALAQEPISLERVGERYANAQTYCETGRWSMRSEPQHPFVDTGFRGCAHRDGRMKYVEHTERDRQIYTWADAARFYRYSEYGSFYDTYPDRDFPTHWDFRRERLPALTSRIFAWDQDHLDGRDALRGLAAYKPKPALSTPERTVFERFFDAHERTGQRLYVSNRNQTLVRLESLKDGVVMRYVEVTAQLDGSVSFADLTHQAPLWVRYSYRNNMPVFLAALFTLATLLGCAIWAWVFARARARQAVLDARRKLWLYYFVALGATVGLLAILTVVALVNPGRGHPPAIFAVYVIGLWAALAFALLACFTLASYPAQWLFGSER